MLKGMKTSLNVSLALAPAFSPNKQFNATFTRCSPGKAGKLTQTSSNRTITGV